MSTAFSNRAVIASYASRGRRSVRNRCLRRPKGATHRQRIWTALRVPAVRVLSGVMTRTVAMKGAGCWRL